MSPNFSLRFPTNPIVRPPLALLPACRVALWLGLPLAISGMAQAQDARAILQKTQKTYQSLSSYSGRAAVTSQIIYKGYVLKDDEFTVAFRCRRPNRLWLDMATPTGSRVVYNDTEHFTVFDVSANTFSRGVPALDLRRALGQLITQAGVFAYLDPLYFLGQDRLPAELGGVTLKGATDWNGHPVFVVTGVTKIAEHILNNRLGQTLVVPAETRRWTWWIDRQSFLLRQIESRAENIKVHVPTRKNGKVTQTTILTSSFTRHIVAEATLNPALQDSEFFFVKPAGAIERHKSK